ncbi:MAG TPA: DUF4440 domain-containing protein [Longimicrobiales bacterium]|nr:DUF4440 domain-containing protein [Longimicrobiales bacterium]
MTERQADRDAILERERAALDRWAAGDPAGYVANAAADATYFDDIAAQERVEGADALRAYAEGLAGAIPSHRYEMVEPVVQFAGDGAILSYRYRPTAEDGTPMTEWRATTVYRREDGGWNLVHAHWTMQKQA